MTTVAGIDGWRKGWVVAVVDDDGPTISQLVEIREVGDLVMGFDAVAIDMPISLPVRGRRGAEQDLKTWLGAAGRSVFYSPTRAALDANDRASASAINVGLDGPGISAQSWGLAAPIRSVRSALRDAPDRLIWWETHPETAFAVMNGGTPLSSKRTARGVFERLDLLRGHYPSVDHALAETPAGVPIDDALDAVAAGWSAMRIATDMATVFGPAGRDDEGFPLGVRV